MYEMLETLDILYIGNTSHHVQPCDIIAYCGREGQIYAAFRFRLITLLSFFPGKLRQ